MHHFNSAADAPAPVLCLTTIEAAINEILHSEWAQLISDPAAESRYGSIFDRSVEVGFYDDRHRAHDTQPHPDAKPNEAYIQAHEAMWQPVDRYLDSVGLRLGCTFRQLFLSSREYEDSAIEHRRVFFGEMTDARGRGITAFMLTVPHSHECFRFSMPMRIALSQSIVFGRSGSPSG